MPTSVHFVGGGEHITLEDEFDKVNSQLHGTESGLFQRRTGGDPVRVLVYKSAVTYIEDASYLDQGPSVGVA